MKSLNKISFIATCVYLALSSCNEAFAACDNASPGSGQTVTCDTGLPNPSSTAVTSAAGVSNVSVNIGSGSVLNVSGSAAISLGGGSQITNAGQLTGSSGIGLREGSSVVNNSGSITGTTGPGVVFNGSGNNQLTNSGTIRGGVGSNAVTFGGGDDTLIVTGGTITGSVDQGNGADKAVISAGTITDTLSQGSGIDDFVMSGGTLGALEQGDNRDTFTMTGGTIVNAFEDGDVAKMTGGKIGRVNMKLDNNIFDMSGGEIVGNLVTGFGNDTITVSGSSVIGGNISVSGGADSVTVTGGIIKGDIRMSTGNDTFHWEKGSILGSVLMEADNDRIELTNLDAATAATSPLIDGGSGDDTLVMNNSQYIYSAANLLRGIEHINLTNNSTLTLNNKALPLGDAENDGVNTGYSIDGGSTLAVQSSSATAFKSHLSGSGTLSTNLGGNAFSFDSNNAGDNFAGTLALGNATLELSGLNTQALGQATLKAGADSVTTVGAGVQRIGGLTFDGGTVDFGNVAPGNTQAANTVQTANRLDLSGSGTVQVGVNNALNATPVALNNIPLLAQDDANTTIRLAGADGAVIGNAGGLTLIDRNGNVITDSVTDAIEQNGAIVAQGTWDWRLTSGENQDGLYIGYALKQLDLQGSGGSALVLNGDGASGNAADMSAKITGSGDLAIENPSGGAVSLSNQSNDYSGVTDLRSGSLLMNNNNVLGNTSLLQLAAATTFNMQGFAQTVGQVNSAENSEIVLDGGSLTVDSGGSVNGQLLGSGALTLNGGVLDINGDNASLAANSRILSGATVNLTGAAGLGSGAIDNAGLLNLNGAYGSLQNALSNGGAVSLYSSQTTLTGDNSLFSGTFNIDSASQLTAGGAQQLGSAVVNDSGTLMLIADADWTLNNIVSGEGKLIKEGPGVLTLTQASADYRGETAINQGGINFGSRDQPVTLASSVVNINQGFLAGNGTVAGDVNNASLLQVGNSSSSTATALTRDALTVGGNLTNGGKIQLAQTGSGVQAGNVLTVNGDYIGNGGSIVFNTVLGDDRSATDLLSVKGDSSGSTQVSVENVGGSGARTLNGIELINVGGSSAGDFLQSGRIVAGAYDYRLTRGAGSNQSNWYLTNSASAPAGSVTSVDTTSSTNPGTPTNPTTPTNSMTSANPTTQNGSVTAASADEVMLRPEAGSYIEDLAAANTMFTTRLHDRLGETQYTDALNGEKNVTSLWLRQVGTRSGWRSNIGSLKTSANQYVAMLGGDLVQWSSDGLDRGHIGIMGGYGNNQSHTRSTLTGNASKGQVSGYSVGVYGTWYANDATKTGPYVDSWLQYGWFKNKVNGEGLAQEKYNANGFSASLESGYSWKVGEFHTSAQSLNTVYIQPQAQIIWMGVKADNHTEANGTQVSSDGNGNIQTRLGTRLFIKGHSKIDDGKSREFEPFIEVNWLHNTRNFSTDMNGVSISQNGAKNLGEVRTGVEGQLTKNLTAWGNVGQQLGDEGYRNTEAMLGVKYAW